jgi:Icc-related predicted phosphoesterase
MKIVMLTDLHGRIDRVPGLAEVFKSSDLVILAGDITHFGNSVQLKNILSVIRQYQPNILAVSGNCDPAEIEKELIQEGINLHARSIIRDNLRFAGLSGSLPCPGKTPNEYTEIEFTAFIEEINVTRESSLPLLLVSHQPPFNCKNDKVGMGIHVGSHAIRTFIETGNPILCLCGHIHEGIGIDTIGKTMIVNPGPFRTGHYAIINILTDKIEAELF